MSLETSSSRMRRLGRSELVEGEIPTLDEVIARIEARDRRRRRAGSSTGCSRDAPRTLAVVGPHDESEFPAYAGATPQGAAG